MNVFESTSQLYAVLAGYDIEHVIVKHDDLREFTFGVGILQGKEGYELNDTVAQLSLLRYWYSNCPLPTDAALYREHPLTSKLISDLETGARWGDHWDEAIYKNLTLLRSLWFSGSRPLLDEAYEVVERHKNENVALLVRQRNWIDAVQAQVLADGISNITVLAPTDVAHATTYDLIVTIGNHHQYPDHVFTAPRAPSLVAISFAWHGNLRKFGPSLLDTNTHQSMPLVPQAHTSIAAPLPSLAVSSEYEESYLEARLKSHYASSDRDGFSSVPGSLARLFGDYSVFLDASGDNENLVIDPELDGSLRKVPSKEIRAGMFIVLRSDTGDDHIEEAADILLGGDAAQYRTLLRSWKAKLRIRVGELGQDRTSTALQDMGLRHATENNIRNWCSNRSIATRWKHDFAILMEFLGMEEETDTLWAVAKAVRDAHLSAGMRISKQLKLMIKEQHGDNLGQQGRIDFEHPTFGGARLSAFRIELISPFPTQVSENNLLRLLDPKEG